jgi:hypothetical protein
MKKDSIVQEVREARASIAAEFGYDLSKYLIWVREQTRLRKEALAKTSPMDAVKGKIVSANRKRPKVGATVSD